MKRSTKVVLVLFGLFFFAAAGVAVYLTLRPAKARVSIASKTVLKLDLERRLPETAPENPFAVLRGEAPLTLRGVVETLERAGADDRVSGLVARVGAAPLGMAGVQEIRDAVKAFRAKKKFAVVFSETFGEFGPGNGAYYLATAFDEIWLQPSGDVGLNGWVLEAPFLRGMLDKLGVTPQFGQRYEYKNAMNVFTDTKFTDSYREAEQRLLDSISGQTVRGIAEGRKLSEAGVRALIDRGPFLGTEAKEAKLVDGLAYWDEISEKVKARAGAGAEFLSFTAYRDGAGSPYDSGARTLALIYGVGGVARGRSGYNPVTESWTMGSETVASAFRKAVKDSDVAAIVFRVDSPGGSYVASDTIWREVSRARKAGKPVVVSMGSVAASGGYFVAMNADRIVAEPGTITGSIGVLGGKFVTPAMWEKVGITFDQVESGTHANFWNSSRPYSEGEWVRFNAWLDRVYEDFTSKVAEGRKLPKERVLEIAKGRVWTGEDAKDRGLVDELGGLSTAIRAAKDAAKIPPTDSVRLVEFPKRKSPFESLMTRLSGGEDEEGPSESSLGTLDALRPLVRKLEAAGLLDTEPGVLRMRPFEIR
ncbi:MAG: signal peptide peptidase SppA [Thermoanaerobaculia bacterium]